MSADVDLEKGATEQRIPLKLDTVDGGFETIVADIGQHLENLGEKVRTGAEYTNKLIKTILAVLVSVIIFVFTAQFLFNKLVSPQTSDEEKLQLLQNTLGGLNGIAPMPLRTNFTRTQ